MIKTCVLACMLIVLSFGMILLGAGAHAQSTACSHTDDGMARINTFTTGAKDQMRPLMAEYFLHQTGALGTDDITTQVFQPGTCSGIFDAPTPSQTLWLRFVVSNPHALDEHRVIGFVEYILDEVILFELHNGELREHARNGRTLPSPAKADTAIKVGFPIIAKAGQDMEFYLRIRGTFAPTVTAMLMSPGFFDDWTTLEFSMSGLTLAYLSVIALVSLIVFRHIAVRFYKYYTLYMLCLFIFTFLYDGWLTKLFGVTLPVTLAAPVFLFFTGLGNFANVQYCRILLKADAAPWAWQVSFKCLSGVVILVTGLAVLDPWRLTIGLHLIYFVSPMILLAFAIQQIRAGLPQAWPVSASLLALSVGLFVAFYSFLFPAGIPQASFAYELVVLRPLALSYSLAIMGETLFMMLAISTMVRAMQTERQAAVVELAALEHQFETIKKEQNEVQEVTSARLEALETALVNDPNNRQHLSVKQQFLERATESVLDNISDQDFGVMELASELAVSHKTLGRRLKEANGHSPASFIRSVRLSFARNLILLHRYKTVSEVSAAAGFASVSHFSKLYREEFGETPGKSISLFRSIQ
ncbi:helix-turn-helix domain-containing protein [uncultured Tateyamaria sp.]|uniref:helix-turn-helix domain-containing protein n=1 Tax=uncultured Tateyamaria sp. TaxID=455651 RepID=UPI002634BAAA|nr:helix-turn-helix domain-containing protein [uncultured Tateyamaria sp.]